MKKTNDSLKKIYINRILSYYVDDDFVCDVHDGRWLSYRALWKKAYIFSRAISRKKTDRVVVILENGLNLFTLYFAAMLSNVKIIPIDPRKSNKEIDYILSENCCKCVIQEDSDIFVSDTSIEDKDIIEAIRKIDLFKEYIITYTSGSTAFPKGVRHSLINLLMSADSFGNAVGLNGEYTMCHVMPMAYMAGILNTIILPFLCGCKIVLMSRFDVMSATSFWRNVQMYGINAFWVSPAMLKILMLVDREGKGKDCLKDTKSLFLVGTGALYENIRKKFESKYSVSLLQSYGLSETLFLTTELPQRKSPSESVGYLLPDVDIDFGEEQEVLVRVPWGFLGYTNDITESYFIGQYYRTGDLGKCNDAILTITGRKKDLIIKGGKNISPKLIEDVIIGSRLVDECAVSGIVKDDEERIVCWYVSALDIDLSKINRKIGQELGREYCVDRYIRITELPRNLNGKVDKKILAQGIDDDFEI